MVGVGMNSGAAAGGSSRGARMTPPPVAARLVPVEHPAAGLPPWCDRFLHGAAEGEFFASRLWYDTLIGHALAPGEQALCLESGAVLMPMLRSRDAALANLATPYTLDWRPLPAHGADLDTLREAGRILARMLRFCPPLRLDTIDPEAPGLAPLLAGLRQGGIHALRYHHMLNWHEALPPGTGWESYLAARPPALRTTIRRKLARAAREMAFERMAAPGPALEAGIAAYEAVRAGSWKPAEPFPDFDAALMRAAAAAGLLRLGVLRRRADGVPVAAQYWVLDRGGTRASVLKLSHLESERAASPGTALTALMIQGLLADDSVQELDFGRGDDAYKRLWVGTARRRIGLVVADPMHPAGLAAIARQGLGALRRRWMRKDGRAA